MILNGDFFDDLKLTDDDIKSSDDNNYNSFEYANLKEYYNDMSSKYSHYIALGIKTNKHILTDSNLWNNKIPCMLKKLFYLFDSYGIEYSKPVVSEEDYHISYLIKTKLEDCKFFDFHGYKLITYYNTLENQDLSVLLFFNLPKTQSYTAACKFVGNIMKTLWRNKNYNTFVNSMYVYNIISVMGFALFNPYTHCNKINNIDKTSIEEPYWKLVTIVSLFFPEKKYNNIKKELTEDKQLLLKLYNCFPD